MTGNLSTHEPAPKKNSLPAVWDLVMGDIRERDKAGQERYGTRLQPCNGRDALVDAYQEALDLVVYLRQAIYERDRGYLVAGYEYPQIKCPNGCSGYMTPVAFFDVDELYLFPQCQECGEQADDIDLDWPFIRDSASPKDFERIGWMAEY